MKVEVIKDKTIFIVEKWMVINEEKHLYSVFGQMGQFQILSVDEDDNVLGWDVTPLDLYAEIKPELAFIPDPNDLEFLKRSMLVSPERFVCDQ